MITNELLQYVQTEFAKGVPVNTIKERLATQGWLPSDIAEAVSKLGMQPSASAAAAASVIPPTKTAPIVAPISVTQPVSQSIPVQAERSAPIQPQVPVTPPVTPVVSAPVMQTQPQPAPTMQTPPVASPSAPKHHHKGKAVLMVVIILILIAAGGAGAYAYFTGAFVSLSKVTNEAFSSAKSATSATTDTTLTLTGSSPDESGSFTVKGSYDLSDTTNPKFDANLTLNYDNMGGTAEVRLLDKKVYGQLTNVSNAGMMAPMLSPYLNKWYSYDYGGSADPDLLSELPLPSIASVGSTYLDKMTPDQKAHIVEMTNDAHFITVTKRLAPEKISGVLSYDFMFDLDRPGITQYANDVTAYIHSIGTNDSQLSSFDMTPALSQLSDITNFSGEAWIGINDHLPYKVDINFNATNDFETGAAKVSLVSIFSNWNQPVTVTAPTDSTPIETLISQAEGEMGADSASATDAKIEALLSESRASAELFKDDVTGYKGFCKSSDETGLIAGITSSGIAPADVTCKDGTAYYVMSSKLTDGKSYACADSTGYSGQTTGPVTRTTCPQLPMY